MKKIIILILLLSSIISVSYSQLELKPAIGINVARFDSDPRFDSKQDSLVGDARAGYQIGASLAIGRKMYVEPGIFYNKMNQSFTPTNTENEKTAFTFEASYIRIPVNFGFQLIGRSQSLAGLRIYLGPSMFIPLNVKDNSYPLVKADVKSPQFDIAAGAGLNIWLLFLDVSYGWGLTPQFKDDAIEAKMQALYVNAGFRFKLKNDEE
jgi:hypothetical protein